MMAASIEEELLHLLLTVAIKYTHNKNSGSDTDIDDGTANDYNTGRKILYQVGLLDRFQTVLQLTLYGNTNLKKSLLEAIEIILTFKKSELPNKNQAEIIESEISPNNSYYKSVIIQKIKEMIV
jgi:hypothetical protein